MYVSTQRKGQPRVEYSLKLRQLDRATNRNFETVASTPDLPLTYQPLGSTLPLDYPLQ